MVHFLAELWHGWHGIGGIGYSSVFSWTLSFCVCEVLEVLSPSSFS